MIRHGGLWPFVAAQILLLWIWFVLHAKRLHDAGRSGGLAAVVAMLYVLSLVLLLIVADSFFNSSSGLMDNAAATGALELILLLYVIVTLIGSPHYDLAWLMVVLLMLVGFAPIVVAVLFSIWAAWRPSVEGGLMLHFAYGSNMHRAVMRKHAPTRGATRLARLADYRFVITADGYASVEPARGVSCMA